MENSAGLLESLLNLEEAKTIEVVQEELRKGAAVHSLLEHCRKAMEEVGRRFEEEEYFLADLMYAADIFKKVTLHTGSSMAVENHDPAGKVLLATVQDDIHDIGKNLVASMLEVYGFTVVDLGVNVPPETICSSILEQKPDIVGLSCLLTVTIDSMERTIEAINKKGLRENLKIIAGGFPLNEKITLEIGADAFGKDASEGARKCLELMRKEG